MDEKQIADKMTSDIMRALSYGTGKEFDCIKDLTSNQKSQYNRIIRNTILDYFKKNIIKI